MVPQSLSVGSSSVLAVLPFFFLQLCLSFNPNPPGEGQICPTVFQTLIPLEPNVGLTSNQAVNLSLWFVFRPIKKNWSDRTIEGPGGPFSDETSDF